MKKFVVHPQGNKCPVAIESDTIVDAVNKVFPNIREYANIGNVAGFALDRVWLDYSPSILYGKGGAILHILAHGADSAIGYDATNDPPKEITLWIEATPEDLPEPYEFTLTERPPFDPYAVNNAASGAELLGIFCAFVDEVQLHHSKMPGESFLGLSATIGNNYPTLAALQPELFVSLCLQQLARFRPKADKATAKLMERIQFLAGKISALEKKDCTCYMISYYHAKNWFENEGKITALAFFRNKAGKTQQAVADEVGISLRQEQAYESTSRSALGDAKYSVVVALAAAVGARPEDLIEYNVATMVAPG